MVKKAILVTLQPDVDQVEIFSFMTVTLKATIANF